MHPILDKLVHLLSPSDTIQDLYHDLKLERKQKPRKELTIPLPSPSEHIFLNLPHANTLSATPKKKKRKQTSSTPRSQTQSILFKLPPELRERIYCFVFGDTPRARFGSLRHYPWPVRRQGIEQRRRIHRDLDISLLQSCRQV